MSNMTGEFKAPYNDYDESGAQITRECWVRWKYSRTVDILTVWVDGVERFIGGPTTAAAVRRAIEESEKAESL